MRIGLFADIYLPSVNGVTNHIAYLKRGLEKQGHTVYLFCPDSPGYRDREKNVYRFPTFGSSQLVEKMLGFHLDVRFALPFLDRFSKIASRLDVIHTHHIFLVGSYAAHYAHKYNIPLVYTNHTNYREFEALLPFRKDNPKIIGYMLKSYTRQCCRVISPGQRMKTLLRGYGVKSPIEVIPNGVDFSRFGTRDNTRTAHLKNQLGIAPGDKVLLYVGRLSMEKNLFFLLRAVRSVVTGDPSVRLVVVGDGPISQEIQKKAVSLGIAGNVVFAGFVPYDEIHSYYSLGDIFVTASLSEVFPLTLIEALSAGLPVAAIDATGTGDIVEHGKNGFLSGNALSSYSSAVRKLISDSRLRSQLGAYAKLSARKYSLENFISAHIGLYRSVAVPILQK